MYKRGICLNAVFADVINNFGSLKNRIGNLSDSNIFDGVEFYFKGTDEEYAEIGRQIQNCGLYAVFHAGYEMKKDKTDIGDPDDSKRADAVDKAKRLIEVSYALKAKKMLILSGQKPDSKKEMDTVIKNTVSSLKNLLSYAKEISKDYIMDIVLEFFNDNGEPYLSVGNFNTVELICTEIAIAYDNFHITYDISHVKQLKEDIYEGYDRLKEYINHVHFSNCVTRYPNHSLYGDKHPPFNIEKGDFSDSDMILFLEHLEKSGKIDDIDIISYEVISQNRETSESHYKSIKNSAKKVFLS